MQDTSNTDPGIAVADESFNASERLQRKTQQHG
jgi:hypothetical protein